MFRLVERDADIKKARERGRERESETERQREETKQDIANIASII